MYRASSRPDRTTGRDAAMTSIGRLTYVLGPAPPHFALRTAGGSGSRHCCRARATLDARSADAAPCRPKSGPTNTPIALRPSSGRVRARPSRGDDAGRAGAAPGSAQAVQERRADCFRDRSGRSLLVGEFRWRGRSRPADRVCRSSHRSRSRSRISASPAGRVTWRWVPGCAAVRSRTASTRRVRVPTAGGRPLHGGRRGSMGGG